MGKVDVTHTTICLRASSGLRMNLRVRRVTWASDMMAMVCRNVKGTEWLMIWFVDLGIRGCAVPLPRKNLASVSRDR